MRSGCEATKKDAEDSCALSARKPPGDASAKVRGGSFARKKGTWGKLDCFMESLYKSKASEGRGRFQRWE